MTTGLRPLGRPAGDLRVMVPPNCSPGGKGMCEIRKLMDLEDFPEDFVATKEIKKVNF